MFYINISIIFNYRNYKSKIIMASNAFNRLDDTIIYYIIVYGITYFWIKKYSPFIFMIVNGFFYVLMPFYRKAECLDMASQFELFPASIADVQQSPFHDPFRVMIQFSATTGNTEKETIIIKKNASDYADAFKLLLEQYYVNL